MPSDVSLLIACPERQAVVADRWIGGNGVRDRAQEVLRRPPDFQEGHEPRAWAVSPAEAVAISEAHYDRGVTPDEVRRLAAQFPADRFWWTIMDLF